MTSYASVLTITAFTVERYVAICHPIKAQTLSNLSRAVKIIIIIWIGACFCALPYPIHTRTFYYVNFNGTDLEDSLQCNIPFQWQQEMKYVFQVSTFVFFAFPMAIITVMYVLIGLDLSKSEFSENSGQSANNHSAKEKARKAVVKMLVAVVVAFFFCWAPFHAQRLMTVYISPNDWTPTLLIVQSHLFYVSGVLYFCSSTVNPILYNLISKKFRKAFKRTMCRCFYSVEELMELKGRNRSVLYSDKTFLSNRQFSRKPSPVFTNSSDLQKTKVDSFRDVCQFMNGYNYSPPANEDFKTRSANNRFNDFFDNMDRSRAAVIGSHRSAPSSSASLVSFSELESYCLYELRKSVSESNTYRFRVMVSYETECTRRGSFV